jgi:hypothetical protein
VGLDARKTGDKKNYTDFSKLQLKPEMLVSGSKKVICKMRETTSKKKRISRFSTNQERVADEENQVPANNSNCFGLKKFKRYRE